ncbi:site-specific DNA-methyltransferase [Treponema phagedenis]|uniref:site-specific DNA-methyltransferase n=1 Tax=Treponema phagedenis TaxID=162 RepID=UPI001652E9A3|nr:site-specific DNA-methyltransferase [Treponema phagedenis]
MDKVEMGKSEMEKSKTGKLKMRTENIADANFAALSRMFPNAVTETIDENGEKIRAIDADKLAQEINIRVISGMEERYQFTWPDKRKSVVLANMPIAAALRPCREESVDFDNTENLYIEGDNLDVLKLLRETYLNRVKMIYIDPPYNTGEDFVYEDDFTESVADYAARSGDYDEQGNRLVENPKTNGRFHTDWLNMIYPRLRLAKDLLSDDGVIFISIDDNEVHNLRKVCDEIFGEINFVNCFIWNCSTAGGIRPNFASKTHEYLFSYAKNKELLETFFAPLSKAAISMYKQKDEKGIYRDKDFVFKNDSKNINQKYEIVCPDGEIVHPRDGYIYRFIKSTFDDAVSKNLVSFKNTKTSPLLKNNGEQASWNIYIKKYLGDAKGAPATLIPKEYASMYNIGTTLVQNMFENNRVFENVKPVDYIEYIIELIDTKGSIILDFFSGSATTAHAVMQLNVKDGGNRKYIMVQIPELTDKMSETYKAGYKNICEIGKERIRRAAEKIRTENPDAKFDGGFRVLKLDSSNMKEVYYTPDEYTQQDFYLDGLTDNIKEDRSDEDLLFQVMLDLGIPLSAKITRDNNLLCVNDNYVIACFERVDIALITKIAKRKPHYAVFRDGSFTNDAVLSNFEQVFKTHSPNTIRRIL